MSGRSSPLYCTLILITMHSYQSLLFLTFSALVAITRKKLLYTVANPTLARGLLNRKKKKKKVWQRLPAPPAPPPRCSFGENKNKTNHARIHMSRRYASRRYAGGLGPSHVRTRIPTTRRLGQLVSLRKILRFRPRLQLSQSRCLSLLLAMSGRVFLFFPPRGRVTASTQTSVFNVIACQSPVMPNARMLLCTQSAHSL